MPSFRNHVICYALGMFALMMLWESETTAAGEEVGAVSIAVKEVYGRGGSERLSTEDVLFFNERIVTGEQSAAKIDLLDESTLSIGEKSSLVLDSIVYHKNTGVVEGTFTLVSGLIHMKTAGVTMAFEISTPVAYIGIRGTEFDLLADATRTEVSVREGVVEVTSAAETQSVSAGQSYVVEGDGVSGPSTFASPEMTVAVQQMSTILAGASSEDEESAPDKNTVADAQSAVQQVQSGNPSLDLSNVFALEMAGGLVLIEALPNLAPQHVERVRALVRDGAYDGVRFDFVSPGYAVEISDTTVSTSSAAATPLTQEFSDTPFTRGTVGMSRPADTRDGAIGAFFIALGEAPSLNQQYTVWGRVIYGMEVLDDLAPGRPPSNPDEIKRLNPVLELLDQQ